MNLTNKLLLVDRRVCMVASATWSEAGVSKSRDIGVIIDSPNLAEYDGRIFDLDWDRGVQKLDAEVND